MREKLRINRVVKENFQNSKLIELEKKLTLFMLNTDESFVLVDKTFHIVTFNQQFGKLYKKYFKRPVLKGESILNYSQTHTIPALKKLYKKVFSGEIIESELEIPMPGNLFTTFHIRYKPAYDEEKSIIGSFVSIKDITEIKKAKYTLIESENKYRSIIEHSLIAFFLTIPDDKGSIIQANQAAVKMFGYSLKEFEKLNLQVLFEPKDSGHAKANKDGEANGELVGIRKNGKRFPCEYSSAKFRDVNGDFRASTTLIDISDRKKDEEKLKEKEKHLRIIFNNEPECVSILDLTGKFMEINQAGVKMFQFYSEKDLIGRNISEFLHPSDKKNYFETFKDVKDGKAKNITFRIIGQNKKELWMEANSVPLKDPKSKVYAVLSVLRNITGRILSEQKIRESESNLRAIFESSSEGLMLLDNECVIKAFNHKASENHMLNGISRALKIGNNLIDYIPKSRKSLFKDMIKRVLEGENIEYDIDYNGKKGVKKWFHAVLSPVWEGNKVNGICITRSDISERKIAEQKISEIMERYDLVAKATQDSIYDWNLTTGQVVRSGDGLKLLFGYDYHQINADENFWKSKIHPEDLELQQPKLQEVLKNPEVNISNVEYRFQKADGNYAYVFDKGYIIRNDKGEAIRMIGATQDLSDLKATEQQLKDLLNLTRDQNKRLQNFAHIVSHNIRSHSSNIIGLVELLSEQGDAKLAKNNLFTMLMTSTSKLSETIENLNDIITVQNQTHREKNKVDLRTEIEKTCDAINVLISQTGTKLINKIPKETTVNVIPSYLESILLNLLTNAIKYKSPERNPVIEITCKKSKDFLLIAIKDNGIGIDLQKHQDKLFGMYKTFHNNKDARGFGLFITKNQIEAMNGKIEVESKLDKGTTFKLYIYEKN